MIIGCCTRESNAGTMHMAATRVRKRCVDSMLDRDWFALANSAVAS